MRTQFDASLILYRLRLALDFSKDIQLAEFLGVSAQAIYQARKKNKIPDSWLIRAAQLKSISIDALLNVTSTLAGSNASANIVRDAQQSINKASNKEKNSSASIDCYEDEFYTIPLVAAKLSAGGGSFETEGLVVQRLAFRKSWIQRRGNVENMVLMHVYGDSMEPYIQDGDLALIDTSRKNIIPHTVYAVGVDDGIYIKSVETLPGQKLVLRSFNERYTPIEIDMSNDLADSVRIIGKVLWWCHEA